MTGQRLRAELAAPAILGPTVVWLHWGEPGGAWWLAGAVAFTFVLWSLVVAALLFAVPAAARSCVPSDWRRWWRHRQPGLLCGPLGHHHGRASVPAWVRRVVLAADRWRCVSCGQNYDLQIDHFMPWSLGGLHCAWNFVTLCGPCNRVKSNYWRYPSGSVVYRSYPGSADEAWAAEILSDEQRARRSPVRWLRAVWCAAA